MHFVDQYVHCTVHLTPNNSHPNSAYLEICSAHDFIKNVCVSVRNARALKVKI